MRSANRRLFIFGSLLFHSGFLGGIAVIVAGIAKGPWEYWLNDRLFTGWYAALMGLGATGVFWFCAAVTAIGLAVMLLQLRRKAGE
ncbi:MAG: hypothetical protein LBQ91_03700 [Oscillospiraceae bacterium]|jgi:hypothetical protein|nr:hypothetical protein [Oscillospiraceae bacterium]